jgi:hypothetical protein
MSEITTGKQFADAAFFCPKCGSASLEPGSAESVILAGDPLAAELKCRVCPWVGTKRDVAHVPIIHEFESENAIVEKMTTDLRNVIAHHAAVPLGRFLMNWGFIDRSKPLKDELTRYLSKMAAAMMTAIIEERRAIAEEKGHGVNVRSASRSKD